jgi:RNA polymerase sigma-70 factor (ECF subfamily)
MSQNSLPAAETVTSAYAPIVRRVVRGILRHAHDAEDAEQETLCRILEHLPQFEDRGSLEGWVRKIAVRTSLRLLRRRRYLGWFLEEVPAREATPPDPDVIRPLYDALDRLSARERAVFVLHYQEGLGFAEVAATIGCAEATARNYAFRASQKLRRLLPKR